MDGYAGLKALLPPVERRGLVLIDPPFEAADEFATAAEAIGKAWHKWASGIYMLWYPVKDAKAVALFMGNLAQCGVKRILRLELQIDRPSAQALGALRPRNCQSTVPARRGSKNPVALARRHPRGWQARVSD